MSIEETEGQTQTLEKGLEEPAEIFVECSACQTLFCFKVTTSQALRYAPPRVEPVQDIFPELPIQARAVLSLGNVCGMCLTFDESVLEILEPYIVKDAEAAA